MRFLYIALLLFLMLCIDRQPDLAFEVKEKPDYILVSQDGEFLLELKNEGSSEAYDVVVKAQESFVSLKAPKIVSLGPDGAVMVKATVSASNLKEGKNDFTMEASWRNEKGENSSTKKTMEFSVRRPNVVIEKVESGLLPGKIRIKTNEAKTISVTIRNGEKTRLGDFSLVFLSSYPHFRIEREGVQELTVEGRKFVYDIGEFFSEGDIASKSFEFTVGLPEGTTSASFTLEIMLYWKEYLVDEKELEIYVTG